MLTVHGHWHARQARGKNGFNRAPVPRMDNMRSPFPHDSQERKQVGLEASVWPLGDDHVSATQSGRRYLGVQAPDGADAVIETGAVEVLDKVQSCKLRAAAAQIVDHVQDADSTGPVEIVLRGAL